MAITYCVGDERAKRREFRKESDDRISLDNDEVLASISLSGKTYYAVGGIPYGGMRAGDYISYCRCEKAERTAVRNRMLGLRAPLKKRMRSLTVLEYRAVRLLAEFKPAAKSVYINLDGAEYSRSLAWRLFSLLKRIERFYCVFVSVSDMRLVHSGASVCFFTADGQTINLRLGDILCRRVKRKMLGYVLPQNEELDALRIKKITCSGG